MLVVMEKLEMNRDGTISNRRRTWNYKTVARETLAIECGMSPLVIFAMMHGLDRCTVVDGRQQWESAHSSAVMFMEAGE